MKNLSKVLSTILSFVLLTSIVSASTKINVNDIKTIAATTTTTSTTELSVVVNGSRVVFEDVKPQIIDGRTFIPIRKVSESIDATVAWRQTDRTAHVFRDGKSVMLTLPEENKQSSYYSQMSVQSFAIDGSLVYTSTEVLKPIDSGNPGLCPIISDGRTLLPLRAIFEEFGATVTWYSERQEINVAIPEKKATAKEVDACRSIENNYKPKTDTKYDSGKYRKEAEKHYKVENVLITAMLEVLIKSTTNTKVKNDISLVSLKFILEKFQKDYMKIDLNQSNDCLVISATFKGERIRREIYLAWDNDDPRLNFYTYTIDGSGCKVVTDMSVLHIDSNAFMFANDTNDRDIWISWQSIGEITQFLLHAEFIG